LEDGEIGLLTVPATEKVTDGKIKALSETDLETDAPAGIEQDLRRRI
jgi:hypothetical protein